MQQSYQICSQNDVDRRGGMQDAFITVCGPFSSFGVTAAGWRYVRSGDWENTVFVCCDC